MPRVYGGCPGTPMRDSGSHPSRSAAVYSGWISMPESVRFTSGRYGVEAQARGHRGAPQLPDEAVVEDVQAAQEQQREAVDLATVQVVRDGGERPYGAEVAGVEEDAAESGGAGPGDRARVVADHSAGQRPVHDHEVLDRMAGHVGDQARDRIEDHDREEDRGRRHVQMLRRIGGGPE